MRSTALIAFLIATTLTLGTSPIAFANRKAPPDKIMVNYAVDILNQINTITKDRYQSDKDKLTRIRELRDKYVDYVNCARSKKDQTCAVPCN